MSKNLEQARATLQSGQIDTALGQLLQITAAEPDNASAFSLLAMANVHAKKLPDAQRAIQRAIALAPQNVDFHLTAANIEQDMGKIDAAIALLQDAIRLQPSFAQAHNNLGIILCDQGKLDEAVATFSDAIRLNPQYARAHTNLAGAQLRMFQLPEAMKSAQRAIELQPDYAHAYHLLANVHSMLGDPFAAEASLATALKLKPNMVESSLLMARVLGKLKRPEDAERIIQQALSLTPSRAELWSVLGDFTSARDDLTNALAAYKRSLELRPNDVTTTARAALVLPHVYSSESHLAACRERFTQGLNYLVVNADVLSQGATRQRLGEIVSSNFLLAYQGCDDTILQRSYANFIHALVLRVAPEQVQLLPHHDTKGRRIRIGFCSGFFYTCTVGHYFLSWVTDLDRSIFEVFVYQTNVINDHKAAQFKSAADHYVQGVENFTFFSQRIAADELDILIYPELGMDVMCFLMAALRLAPVQISAWGHPVTPGHQSIDYYISCAAMEPSNAQLHYNERLLTLPGIGTRYDLPTLSPESSGKSRADFQLPEDANLYLFPQSLFKVHPANDALLVAAMANDPKGVLVMFAGPNDGVTQRFITRLSAIFVAHGVAPQGRVKLLPNLSHDDYKRVNALCDVMLDTLHWSGGNTSLDALAMGLPIVTLPGEFMRGRQTLGMLTLLGVEELIATSTDDYLALAKKLATDKPYRNEISAKIRANLNKLFNDPAPTKALGELLQGLLHAAPAGQ
jgi:protein O-GlcNAc transferase